jgi:MFS family permease
VALGGFGRVLRSAAVWRLASGAFFLHLLLMALFVPLPLTLVDTLQLPGSEHWKVYGPVMLGAFVIMLPLMRAAERSGRVQPAMAMAVLALSSGSLALWSSSSALLLVLLAIFFTAFNLLESLMPAQVTRQAPEGARGAATGLYATMQFLGAFTGGSLGGYLFGLGGVGMVAALGFAVVLAWALLWWLLRERA